MTLNQKKGQRGAQTDAQSIAQRSALERNKKLQSAKKDGPEYSGAASLFDPAIQFIDSGTDNEFAQDVSVRHKLDPRAKKIFATGVALVVIYCLTLLLPHGMIPQQLFYHNYSLASFIDDVSSNVNDLILELSGVDVPWADFSSEMIKYLIIAISGAGLALCGAVYQGAFRNALVSPSTLGVMTGAGCGLTIWVGIFLTENGDIIVPFVENPTGDLPNLWYTYSSIFFSFLGCFIVVGSVLLMMKFARAKASSAIFLIITGQIVSSVFGAISSAVSYYFIADSPFSAKAEFMKYLMTASFWRSYSWVDVVTLVVPIVVVFAVVMHLRQKMMVLAFDEAERRTMGVDSRRTQIIVVGLCTLLTAIIVSFCGVVGFVGFLVPHLARRLVGPNFRYLIPAAAVLGATFVLGCYMVLLTLMGQDYADIVGLFISIAGGVVFLITALRGGGVKNGKFN